MKEKKIKKPISYEDTYFFCPEEEHGGVHWPAKDKTKIKNVYLGQSSEGVPRLCLGDGSILGGLVALETLDERKGCYTQVRVILEPCGWIEPDGYIHRENLRKCWKGKERA